jgi:hypothetical protein
MREKGSNIRAPGDLSVASRRNRCVGGIWGREKCQSVIGRVCCMGRASRAVT